MENLVQKEGSNANLECLIKKPPEIQAVFSAGGKGFEPLLDDPESSVLPLDEPPRVKRMLFYHQIRHKSSKSAPKARNTIA